MQRSSSTSSTSSRSRLEGLGGPGLPDGEKAARLLKFYRQRLQLSAGFAPVPLARVAAKSLYDKHKAAFDGLVEFFDAHGLDVPKYVQYFAQNLDGRCADLDQDLFSGRSLEKYYEWLHGIDKRRRIYEWFAKSARNLAKMCADGGFMSPRDCFVDALRRGKMSQLVVSGQISAYFLAAIPGFRDVIPRLDHFARQDLAELYDRFDMYSADANEAVLAARNRKANPFKMAAEEL